MTLDILTCRRDGHLNRNFFLIKTLPWNRTDTGTVTWLKDLISGRFWKMFLIRVYNRFRGMHIYNGRAFKKPSWWSGQRQSLKKRMNNSHRDKRICPPSETMLSAFEGQLKTFSTIRLVTTSRSHQRTSWFPNFMTRPIHLLNLLPRRKHASNNCSEHIKPIKPDSPT